MRSGDETLDSPVRCANRHGLGTNQKKALDALKEALDESGEPSPDLSGMPSGGQVTTWTSWTLRGVPKMPEEEAHRRKQTFKRTSKKLIERQVVGNQGDHVWLI